VLIPAYRGVRLTTYRDGCIEVIISTEGVIGRPAIEGKIVGPGGVIDMLYGV
jgi:hypothetical protein